METFSNIWIQLITGSVAVLSATFLTIRYAMQQTAKREKALLDHTKDTQEKMLEYFEKKNGHLERVSQDSNRHLERVSKDFTETSRKMADAITNLTIELKSNGNKRNKKLS